MNKKLKEIHLLEKGRNLYYYKNNILYYEYRILYIRYIIILYHFLFK